MKQDNCEKRIFDEDLSWNSFRFKIKWVQKYQIILINKILKQEKEKQYQRNLRKNQRKKESKCEESNSQTWLEAQIILPMLKLCFTIVFWNSLETVLYLFIVLEKLRDFKAKKYLQNQSSVKVWNILQSFRKKLKQCLLMIPIICLHHKAYHVRAKYQIKNKIDVQFWQKRIFFLWFSFGILQISKPILKTRIYI